MKQHGTQPQFRLFIHTRAIFLMAAYLIGTRNWLGSLLLVLVTGGAWDMEFIAVL